MGRTAQGRSELVELADDSASSTGATIPPSPRGARSMTVGEFLQLVFAAQFALVSRVAIACVFSHLVANLAHRDVPAVSINNVSKVHRRRSWLAVVEFEL